MWHRNQEITSGDEDSAFLNANLNNYNINNNECLNDNIKENSSLAYCAECSRNKVSKHEMEDSKKLNHVTEKLAHDDLMIRVAERLESEKTASEDTDHFKTDTNFIHQLPNIAEEGTHDCLYSKPTKLLEHDHATNDKLDVDLRKALVKQKKWMSEKSQSSNTLLNDQVVAKNNKGKVQIERAAHIVEVRPKSHHFLWTIPDPGSQKLNWHKPPLTVLVVKKIYDESVLGPFKELISWLIEVRKMIVFVETNVLEDCNLAGDSLFQKYRGKLQTFKEAKDDLTDKIDFIICLGGDGTLLHASSLFQQSCPPVMAFHQGSLGFLTPFNFDNFQTQVTQVLEGNASLLLRYRLKCVICKEDSELGRVSHIKNIDRTTPCGKSQILVLNEVVVDRGSSSFLCNVDLYVEGRHVTSVQGDGLIISTPTGSTAYAVAAGASMIHPNVPAIMITPICPHSLSFRPIVVPAGVEIKIMLSPEARNPAMVSFDGRNRQEVNKGDSVRITTAQYPLPAVCAKDQIDDWFDRLAECLHWNVRKQQKSLSISSESGSSMNNSLPISGSNSVSNSTSNSVNNSTSSDTLDMEELTI